MTAGPNASVSRLSFPSHFSPTSFDAKTISDYFSQQAAVVRQFPETEQQQAGKEGTDSCA
jgi:hypothetical protein